MISTVGRVPAVKVVSKKTPLKEVKLPGSSAAPQAIALARMRSPKTLIMRKVEEELSKSKKLRPKDTYVHFEVHKATGTIVVKIMDAKTNEVLTEIPSEKLLNIMVDLQALAGVLLNVRR